MPIRLTLVPLLTIAVFRIGYCGQPDDPAAPPMPLFYVGVCTHFGQNKGVPQLNLQMMKTAGINALRDELSWSGTEREKGKYAVPADKTATFHQAAEMDVQPMLIFDYANRLYQSGDRPRSPQALEGYTRYAGFLVRHLGEKVRLYEVWNEYDIGIGMPDPYRQGGSPEDYVRMLKYLYPRLKQLNPEIIVVGGAPTPGGVRNGWLEEIVKLGALDACDLLSVHTYNYGAEGMERTPEAWWAWMQEVQAMLRQYHGGKPVPLLVTEMGWPTHVGKANSTAPEQSASYLARLYLLARTLPFLRGVWWYDFQDDGWDPQYNEANFGIVRPDLTPKPAWYVMADVADLAARGEYLGRMETGDPALWVLRFRLDEKPLWAVWSADDPPRRIILQTDTPTTTLRMHQLGCRPIERPWGHRPWAADRRSRLVPNQISLVVGHRPWLLCGPVKTLRLVPPETNQRR